MVSYYLVIISDPRQRHFSLCSQNDDQLNSNIKLCKISKPPINSQDLVKHPEKYMSAMPPIWLSYISQSRSTMYNIRIFVSYL